MRRHLLFLVFLSAACAGDTTAPVTHLATRVSNDSTSQQGIIGPIPGLGWSATVLPIPAGYQYSRATSISDDGRIAGWILGTTWRRAVRWEGDTLVMAATLSSQYDSEGLDINTSGTMVGYVNLTSGGLVPVRWTSSSIELLSAVGLKGRALSINASGVIVGFLVQSQGINRPVRWQPDGTLQYINIPFGYVHGVATGINDAGDIVGYVYNASAQLFAYRWNATGGGLVLGSSFGPTTLATDIASNRAASGYVYAWDAANVRHQYAASFDATGHGVIVGPAGSSAGRLSEKGRIAILQTSLPQTWKGGSLTTLPLPGRYLFGTTAGVNTCGTTVGSVIAGTGAYRAVKWDRIFCDS